MEGECVRKSAGKLRTDEIAKCAFLTLNDSSFVAGIELFVNGGKGKI
jgi:hypothetical protein